MFELISVALTSLLVGKSFTLAIVLITVSSSLVEFFETNLSFTSLHKSNSELGSCKSEIHVNILFF